MRELAFSREDEGFTGFLTNKKKKQKKKNPENRTTRMSLKKRKEKS